MLKLNSPLIRTAVLAATLGGFGMAAHAQDASSDSSTTTTMAPVGSSAPAMHSDMHHSHGMRDSNVEDRIKTLHDKLKITSDQEDDWSKVAEAMRDNEANFHDMIKERHDNASTMTAVDDLQSYQKVLQAHADGLQKMTTAFETVYNEMSDDQKKNADMVFSSFKGHDDHHTAMKHKK